jgi:hypothetical protein
MGIARMTGVPKIPEKRSDNTDVGSRVAADTSKVEDKNVGDAIVIDDDTNESPRDIVVDDSMYSFVLELLDIGTAA